MRDSADTLKRNRRLALGFVLLTAIALPQTVASGRAQAGQPASSEDGVYVVDEELPALLAEYCRRIGAAPDVSKAIKGEVKDAYLPTEQSQFLEQMNKRYGVEWYFEGSTLHLSAQSETISRLIDIKSLSIDDITDQIAQADIDPARFPPRSIPQGNAMMITAPPSYVARVEVIVDSILKAQKPAATGVALIRFGRKSWAADTPAKPGTTP